MWFKTNGKRSSIAQSYVIRCETQVGGQTAVEEQRAKGVAEARKAAEMLSATMGVTATVYGRDAEGEFVYGVEEAAEGAQNASSPLVKRLYAETAAASLHFRDQMIADIPEEAIKGFSALCAALGYMASEHRRAKKAAAPKITYDGLFRILCGPVPCASVSLPADEATVGLLSRTLDRQMGWMWVSELTGCGSAETKTFGEMTRPRQVLLNIDGEAQVIRTKPVFRGTVPETDRHFLLIAEAYNHQIGGSRVDSVGLVYSEADEAAVLAFVTTLLQQANPFKNRVVLINRDLRTVRSRMSARSWHDIVPHVRAREELDFIADAIRNRDMLKGEGLSIKRGLMLSGPPGDGKSTAIECFVNDIAGEATILIVEAVEHIRAVYALAQELAPSVVILEDLDLMTKARHNVYASVSKDDVTGELLQVLSGGSAYHDIVTIATTNHPEAIDEALSKRAGRFDAHVRLGYPGEEEKRAILDLYLGRFGVIDEFTRKRLHQIIAHDFGKLHLVPAHIEEFVKAGVKRARLARRVPEYADFEAGVEATKSIAAAKPMP